MTPYPSIKEAFADPDLFCTSAAALMTDNFGLEWLEWEPETIEIELRVLGVDPNRSLMDKIMAASTILGTNLFHQSFVAWNNLVQVLNQGGNKSELFVPADLEDMAWGCTEARILEGPETFDAEPFSSDIAVYIGTMLSQTGITEPPSSLSFAIFDPEEVSRRDDALTQDEFIYKAYWDNHREMISDVEKFCIGRSRDLFVQVSRLPLKSADAGFVKKVLEAMGSNEDQTKTE